MNDLDNESRELEIVYATIKDQSLSGLLALGPTAYYGVHTDTLKRQIEGLFVARALEISAEAAKQVTSLFKTLKKKDRADAEAEKKRLQQLERQYAYDTCPLPLERDEKGAVMCTLKNFQTIFTFDPRYNGIRFNLLKNAPEIHETDLGNVSIRPWTDADSADSETYIEDTYKIYSEQKHQKALLSLFRTREYNPVADIINALEWDGTERIPHFLTTWMKCDDTPYTREVSRLIFAGGIHRLFDPGCKFDIVPVLIGTKQGEGKSSIVRWLALNDSFFGEVTQFDGQQAIEALEGSWMCEVAELLALTKARDTEAVKAYITRQFDKYRKPYTRTIVVLPRRCIFIGTTNNRRFLKDKTGNRRFLPVEVHSSGYWLFDHEASCREYILQCWAEAACKYRAGEIPPVPDRALMEAFQQAQEDSMEDDWRVGAIEQYLSRLSLGDKVCARQLFREALYMSSDFPSDPTKKDSSEIGQIMDHMDGWERLNTSVRMGSYGKQKGWIKKASPPKEPDDLPFKFG